MTNPPLTELPAGDGGRRPRREILVCAVLHSSALGGAERSHLERATDLRGEGVVVHSVLPAPDRGLGALLSDAGFPVTLAQNAPWWIGIDEGPSSVAEPPSLEHFVSESAVHASMETFAQIRPDVVLTVTSVNPHAALAARALGIPHVWVLTELAVPIHGLHPTVPHLEIGRAILELSDQVVCVSGAVRTQFFGDQRESDLAEHGIHVIHDAPRLTARPPQGSAEAQRVAGDGPVTIGVIGTFVEGKGQATAVAALKQLVSRGRQARIKFFGTGSAEEVAELRARARAAGVDARVEFLHENDRQAMYAAVDLVAVTSVQEGFGRVPFEAAVADRPIVYADEGALQEFMLPERTGLPFRPHDGDSLADALERLIDDPGLRDDLAKNAKRHLEEFSNTPSRGAQFRAVIDRALAADEPGSWRDVAFDMRASALELGLRRAEREGLLAERDRLALDRDALVTEREALVTELGHIVTERDHLASERDGLREERDWWHGQFHRLQARRSVRIVLALAGLPAFVKSRLRSKVGGSDPRR